MSKHAPVFAEAKRASAHRIERAALEFTEDLVRAMERENVSRSELARRLGCKPAYVTKILKGATNFTLGSMVRIASALGFKLRTQLQEEGTVRASVPAVRSQRRAAAHDLPRTESSEDILDWDVPFEPPPPKQHGIIRARLIYKGRGKPMPVDDPWA